MADGKSEEMGFGLFLLIVLILLVAIPMAITFNLVYTLSRNPYESLYAIAYIFFDATGVDPFEGMYGHIPLFSWNFDALTAIVLIDGLVRIVIIGYIISIFVGLIVSIDLRSKITLFKAKRLKSHVIVAGYYDISEEICKELEKRKKNFVVIEDDEKKLESLLSLGYKAINGDFTNKEVLENAMISKASAIVFTSKDDYKNLFGIVTAHHLNSKLKIISKATMESSVTKMHRAGAVLCVVPEILAGVEIGETLAKTAKTEQSKVLG